MDSPDAMLMFLGQRLLLSFIPLAGSCSGLWGPTLRLGLLLLCLSAWSALLALPVSRLLYLLGTSPRYSAPVAHAQPRCRVDLRPRDQCHHMAFWSGSITPKQRPPGSAQVAYQPIPGMGIFGSTIHPPLF